MLKLIGVGIGGAAIGSAAVLAWAVLSYGPGQYEAGGIKMAAELDAASRKAQGELSNDAERFRFRLVDCRERGPGWVFDFAAGECQQKPAG
ncbi:MAG: hypothetical protein H6881_08250 [Rhodobiaceae bacterium]|nr:hypothetical protein [Rhodobiaceae bacterium]MCC0051854.1 hypothetical protein [Rhodobiaceae bacterium]